MCKQALLTARTLTVTKLLTPPFANSIGDMYAYRYVDKTSILAKRQSSAML